MADLISNISGSQRRPHGRTSSFFNRLQRRPRSGAPTSPSSTSESIASTNTTVSIPIRTHSRPQPPVILPPGDQPATITLGSKVSPLEVRDLNELIRKRYALDIEIWSKRKCATRDREYVEVKMRRSDAALAKIMGIVKEWDRREVWKTDQDWLKLRDIKHRLEASSGQRSWAQNPPWED